jgi:hypothetical protein
MNFKKDYIDYVLRGILQSEFYGVRDDVRVRKVLEKIISVPDTAKATYLAGKTAGLEMLFKYLLYISDKIDKTQVTIFNLKDNYEYDLRNLKKICEDIRKYKGVEKKEPEPEMQASHDSTEIAEETESKELTGGLAEVAETSAEKTPAGETEAEQTGAGESEEEKEPSEFILIENSEKEGSDEEVFGLEGISRSVELDLPLESEEIVNEEETESETEESVSESEIIEETVMEEFNEEEINEAPEYEDELVSSSADEDSIVEKENVQFEEGKVDFEFEIKKETPSDEIKSETRDDSRDGSVASEVYYKFENKFFEDVKILEKLFSQISKTCKGKALEKLSDRTLQRFTEIIEISSELADITRQLEFDLTADVFFTVNLLFTRAIKNPQHIFPERIKLLGSALTLVASLIKDEDYLGHDEIVKKMESLKEDLKKPTEAPKADIAEDEITVEELIEEPVPEERDEAEKVKVQEVEDEVEKETESQKITEMKEKQEVGQVIESKEPAEDKMEEPAIEEKPESKPVEDETVLFKMKYLVKEFEKKFLNLENIHGEYSKYEILEVVDEMNELLRMLAKISASVSHADVLKLSEVSYVFLKYLKDYKMDLLDKEIQQIVKYIIFTYKMLLTNRMPEDFEKLVQYLNNPVKIFTDT